VSLGLAQLWILFWGLKIDKKLLLFWAVDTGNYRYGWVAPRLAKASFA
jgi:hypothetical protein